MKPLVLSFSASRYPVSTFGECIRKARLENGLRQKDVAQAIGVDEMTVVSWERYPTIPKRRRDKTIAVYAVLGLDYRNTIRRVAFCEADDGSAGSA